jgi:antibiotic biosynthesis monooxygenase (ABM) superfamily enzyme
MQQYKKNERHKRTFISWLAIYPLITIILYLAQGMLGDIPLALKTMLITLVVVPLMSYLVMPFYNRIFRKWLER